MCSLPTTADPIYIMKYMSLIFISLLFFSCGKDKVIQLPEISNSDITEITDVSAAYLFYDETQVDSVELNRKNLISTTNWLVNVDKRLKLKQVIPSIKFLQNKKGNSSHKNEKAKNYFTCNDKSRNNLGFIEFTDVMYDNEHQQFLMEVKDTLLIKPITFNLNGAIFILNPSAEPFLKKSSKYQLIDDLKMLDSIGHIISLRFNENISFQDYITYKSIVLNANLKYAQISNHEFLDN